MSVLSNYTYDLLSRNRCTEEHLTTRIQMAFLNSLKIIINGSKSKVNFYKSYFSLLGKLTRKNLRNICLLLKGNNGYI